MQKVLRYCYFLPCEKHMFKATPLKFKATSLKLCSRAILPLLGFISPWEFCHASGEDCVPILTHSLYLTSTIPCTLKKCAKVVSHHLSLIFTFPLKERSITVLCLLSRIYFSRNQMEFQVAKQSGKQSSKMKEFSIVLPTAVRDPPQYMKNNSIKWAASS